MGRCGRLGCLVSAVGRGLWVGYRRWCCSGVGVVRVKLRTPRAPEPEAPYWQVVAMMVAWLGGGAALSVAMVGNLVVQVVR